MTYAIKDDFRQSGALVSWVYVLAGDLQKLPLRFTQKDVDPASLRTFQTLHYLIYYEHIEGIS